MATIVTPPVMAAGSMAQPQGVREIPLKSSFLQQMKYDPQTFQLTVTMKNGAEYTHFFVYPMTVEQMLTHPSPGQFYSKMVKGRHPSIKVTHKSAGPALHHLQKGPIHHARRRA